MRVAVVGAGPSGLVTLKYLVTAHKFLGTEPIEARLFESEAKIGGTFVARVYEDAEVSYLTFLQTRNESDTALACLFQTTHHILGLET